MRRVRVEGLWLRPLSPEDRGELEVLAEQAFEAWATQPAQAFTAMLASSAHAVVAVLDGSVAGFALSRRVDGPPVYGPWERPHVQHVDAVAVHRHLRRRGVGAALVSHLVELAERDGARGIFAMTAADNYGARALLEGAGLDYLAGMRGAYRMREPAVLMFRYLPPLL